MTHKSLIGNEMIFSHVRYCSSTHTTNNEDDDNENIDFCLLVCRRRQLFKFCPQNNRMEHFL